MANKSDRACANTFSITLRSNTETHSLSSLSQQQNITTPIALYPHQRRNNHGSNKFVKCTENCRELEKNIKKEDFSVSSSTPANRKSFKTYHISEILEHTESPELARRNIQPENNGKNYPYCKECFTQESISLMQREEEHARNKRCCQCFSLVNLCPWTKPNYSGWELHSQSRSSAVIPNGCYSISG